MSGGRRQQNTEKDMEGRNQKLEKANKICLISEKVHENSPKTVVFKECTYFFFMPCLCLPLNSAHIFWFTVAASPAKVRQS